jgi:hypothetical protein
MAMAVQLTTVALSPFMLPARDTLAMTASLPPGTQVVAIATGDPKGAVTPTV